MKTLAKLSETSVNRLLNAHAKNGYCVISASWSENSQAENDKLDNSLIADVQAAGYLYTPIYGGYKEKAAGKTVEVFEKSVIVYRFKKTGKPCDFLELVDFMAGLCVKYRQECFAAVFPGKPPAWVGPDGKILKAFSGKLKLNDVAQEYFSTLKRSKSAGQSVTFIPEAFIGVPCNWLARQLREAQGEVFCKGKCAEVFEAEV